MELLAKASVIEHMMRGPHHCGIRLLPGEVAVFEQPSSAWPVAMLKQLDEVHLTGDGNSLNANATKIITGIQEFYRHPGRFINRWGKAMGVVVNGMKWVLRQHYHQERGVAVYLGAGRFSQGGWKANAVREGFRKVVEQPSRPGLAGPDRLVIVHEFRSTRDSSSVHARQPCELHLPIDRPRPADWVPPAGQVNQRLLRPAWSLRHSKDEPPPPAQDQPPAQAPPGPAPRPQAPSWGRWLDRDTNPCLNFQRIGESRQRPLELCSYEGLKALPPIGKEYQQGYKRVNDRLPKVKQRLHRAAEYRRGIDGRARNNA
ncbi:hypothetical protein QJQ45_013895 [Haematococcus lacustris]|nr:hypothetical protein QJQ45_013895 [Haematococcus lacustris]